MSKSLYKNIDVYENLEDFKNKNLEDYKEMLIDAIQGLKNKIAQFNNPEFWHRIYIDDGYELGISLGELAEIVKSNKITKREGLYLEDMANENRTRELNNNDLVHIKRAYEDLMKELSKMECEKTYKKELRELTKEKNSNLEEEQVK